MKIINAILLLTLLSCNHDKKNDSTEKTTESGPLAQETKTAFFPVTNFLNGQIAEIKRRGINPLKTTIKNNQKDSIWIKQENMTAEFAPFLSPVIDSTNLYGMFNEKNFLDQTIDAFTFTYDPVKPLPDTFLLQHWDVYVDPRSNTVTRIYMLKKTTDHKTLQLTWQTNKSCKMVTISADPAGNDHVEQEVTIKWDF